MDTCFHEVSQCSNALLGSTVSQWPLGTKGLHGVKHISYIPGVPEEQHWPLVSMGPAVSQWPHHYTRSCSVTMLCMVPQGPAVSQWPLWFYKDPAVSQWTPCFHVAPQCHSGPLALWCHVVHSVTLVLSVPPGPAVSQWPLASPGPCSVTIITESPRLEKTFESIKSNL